MTRRAWQVAASAAALYLIVLLWTLPAAVVLPRLVTGTPAALGGIEGTLWRGSAATLVVDGFPVYALRWRVEPRGLLRARLQAQVEGRLDEGFIRGRVGYSPVGGRLQVENAQGATRLARLAGPAGFTGADGNLSLQLELLVLEAGWPTRLSGRLGVGGLSIQELARQPLGDFEASFRLDGEEIVADLADIAGMLELQAQLKLTRELRWDLQGEVAPRADAPAGLREAISMLGPPDDRGLSPFGLGGRL